MVNHANLILGSVLVFALTLSGVARADGDEVHWGYEGAIGPAHWGELSPAFETCATGTQQSPINIPSSAPTNPGDLQFRYQPSDLTITNTGHSIQANYDPGSVLQVDGQAYPLAQFHFHSPSEHTVDGKASPLSLHLVHKSQQGELAVVSVFLVEGERNAALAPVFGNLPATAGTSITVPGTTINASEMLPAVQRYWRYNGSLTTPPCTEGVKWFFFQEPVAISAEQIAAHRAIYSGNARPTQPLHGRQFIVGQQPASLPATGAGSTDRLTAVVMVAGMLLLLSGAACAWEHRRRAA